ncbi:hypothetical protein F4677DRAFT_47606 [Hypoxylon crocopeplum]|nr:hypothetical protein F4677DRAFT_47606 [Hypoxylon crocopeplum]
MQEDQSSEVDIPSPLHIIKRGKSMQVLRGSPRKFSGDSFDDGPDQPLTVVKNRKSQRRVSGRKNLDNIESSHNQDPERQFRSVTANTASSETWDPVTPKPRKVPVSRRSSSVQVGQPPSPTFLTRLRSLSNRRALSSKTTHRRYDLRAPSDSSDGSLFQSSNRCVRASSWDRSSDSGYSEPPSYLNEPEAHSFDSSSLSNSFLDVQTPDSSIPDPYMLVPHISIIPESQTLADGQSSFWAAIEISGQLFHPRTSNSTSGPGQTSADQPPFIPTYHCDVSLSRYGYLYNIKVDILPTTDSGIIDIIGDTERIISPGFSLLFLACIRLGATKAYQSGASGRDSANLFADLESQLGNAKTEYMQVRVNYCHSGFPMPSDTGTGDSTSACQTRLETIATGVIQRHDPTSTWSPRPTSIVNPLFSIVASHWGPTRANEVVQRVISTRCNPRRSADWTGAGQSKDAIKPPSRTGTAPPTIPRRQTSLKRLSPQKLTDPARKIWTELRQTSSGNNRPAFHVNKANRLPAATTFVDAPDRDVVIRPLSTRPEPKSEIQRQREVIRETALRNKRSIGADTLKSLVPSVAETGSYEGKENVGAESPSPPGKGDVHFDGRKREGRWSLGGWW